MPFQFLSFELDKEGIALITVRRPEKRNALNSELIQELAVSFQQAADDGTVRALILTGEGETAFVAGADITEVAGADPIAAEAMSRRGQRAFRLLETIRKPSLAAINGFALGGGLELALCASVRFASTTAKLGTPEVKLGIVPGYGATQRLPRLIGRGRAMEMLLSGEPVDAAEAHRIGLVNAVFEPTELLSAARTWLVKVLRNGPVALALAMEAVDAGLEMGLEAGLRFESAAFGLAASSADKGEGMQAFLEKRKAIFTGR